MSEQPSFADLGLNDQIQKVISHLGYETPSPIQAKAIPLVLSGRDILGQAQTGTGKTAAFALPILQKLELKQKEPQILVLAPTRELAIQVAEAFQSYANSLKGFHVLPIYGGQSYETQLRALRRGVHVIVGTPGRIMDHMRRKTLQLGKLKHLVLDEADEMLRMGFIDDVEWILSHIPEERQISLFSATMPREIEKVANTYLRNPELVKIEVKTATADTIRQRYWPVTGLHKLDAATRILEAETFDGMIIFVRTKTTTVELAEKLSARGYNATALNGDISQAIRERTIEKLKKGQVDILVATDVAARGLDVQRISHVLNYDIPYDTEAYVHRIGRTGRAGRSGEAILFVAKREMHLLRSIERATNKKIELMKLPSAADINEQRVSKFMKKIDESLESEQLSIFRDLIQNYQKQKEVDMLDLSAALAFMAQGDQPLFLKDIPESKRNRDGFSDEPSSRRKRRSERFDGEKGRGEKRNKDKPRGQNGLLTYRIEVGHNDGVKPGSIVGAIANEANLDSQHIGHIKIHDDFSTVDLPKGMPAETMHILKKARVCQKPLNISVMKGSSPQSSKKPSHNSSDKTESKFSKKDNSKFKKKDKNRSRQGPSSSDY